MVAFSAFGQIMTARYVDGQMQHRFLTRVGVNLRPRWSPDGSRLAFYTQEGAVKTMNANGQGMRTVVSGGSLPTWQSPSRIDFVRTVGGKGDIYSVASTGGALTRLTKDGAATCGNLHPAFSYDGRYLAYVQKRPVAGSCADETTTVLKVVNRVTGATRVVLTVPWSEWDEPPFEELAVAVGRVDFDASGRRVMFTVEERCPRVWAVLDVRNGSFTFSDDGAECGHYSYDSDNAPLPAGGFAVDAYDTERYQDLDVQPVTS